jgi:hypothetical protein
LTAPAGPQRFQGCEVSSVLKPTSFRSSRVKRQRLCAEPVEQLPPGWWQQIRVILDAKAGLGSRHMELCRFLGTQGWATPDPQGVLGEPLCPGFDLGCIPGFKKPEALVEMKRAVLESAFHVALFREGTVRVLRVVASKGEVAEGVEVLLLDVGPVLAEGGSPLRGEILVLREDVLDRVVLDRYVLLPFPNVAKVVLSEFVGIGQTARRKM